MIAGPRDQFRTPLPFLVVMPSYGDLAIVRLGPEHTYMAYHPKLVRQVLFNPRVFEKGGRLFDKARPSFGNGLVTGNWQEHRRQRSILQPSFHRAKVDTYAPMMAEEVDAVVVLSQLHASLRSGVPVRVGATLPPPRFQLARIASEPGVGTRTRDSRLAGMRLATIAPLLRLMASLDRGRCGRDTSGLTVPRNG
jgi:hypothetical protein